LFLSHLSPQIAVHRLAAVSSRWDELVAPDWSKYNLRSMQFIKDHMNQNNLRQGDRTKNL